MKPASDEWSPTMYAVLIDCGIKPWEFGELTFPWLRMIKERGQVQEPDESLEWKVRQARATAKEFMGKIKDHPIG